MGFTRYVFGKDKLVDTKTGDILGYFNNLKEKVELVKLKNRLIAQAA